MTATLRVDDGKGGAAVLRVSGKGAAVTVETGTVPELILGAASLRHFANLATIAAAELDRIARVGS